MKKLTTVIFLLISFTAIGQTQNNLTAKQILESSIAFCGGEKRIAEIESSSLDYLLIQADKSTAIVTEKRKTGKKYVQSILSMTHVPQTTFFDGNILAQVNGNSVRKVMDVETRDEIKLKTFNQIQFGYKVLDYELTRLPDKRFQNFDCYVVNAESKSGYTTMNFFDKANFRLLMVVYPNGNKSLMIEYAFKDSVLFNSHIVNTFANSEDNQVLKLRNIHSNVNISELWFTCPYQDSVYIPSHIRIGEFASTNGEKTIFRRTEKLQNYYDSNGKIVLRRFLKWISSDIYGLIDERAIKENDTSPESQILVRIIAWDDNEYVCHWMAGKYTDTQDYEIKNKHGLTTE